MRKILHLAHTIAACCTISTLWQTLLKGSELAVRELGKNEDKEEKGKDKKKDGDDAQLTQPVVAPPPIKVHPLPEQPCKCRQ